MLVVLTLKKAYETRRELKEEGMLVPSILVLVVRDGELRKQLLVYFKL